MQPYEGQICRPPMERGSFMLGAAVGCAYNRCIFCTLFKHLRHRLLPLEEVEAELRRVSALGANPPTVFLGDGNAFGMDTARLLAILSMIRRYFPACESVNMDATVTDIANKSDTELQSLFDAGVRRLYLGIEGALDDVLAFMQKDHSVAQAEEQIARIRQTGLQFDAHIMTGVSGAGRGEENAHALAAFFKRTRPGRIINFSLFLHRSAPLYAQIRAGRFRPADELENLREAHTLISRLDIPCQYDGFHDKIELRVRGSLPGNRDKMLALLERAIAREQAQPPVYAYMDDVPWQTALP